MKKSLLLSSAIALFLFAFVRPAAAAFPEAVRQSLRLCAEDIQVALAASPLTKNLPLAILPVNGDQDAYVIGLLKNAVTGSGQTCVEGREDPFWEELVKEIETSDRKSDLLDPATLTRFGKLKSAKLLLYAVVRDTAAGSGSGYAEVEVHVSSIETKQHLWGKVFARRFYNAPDVKGLVDLDSDVREVIRKSFDKTIAQLQSDPKLQAIHTVAVVPLAGDLDRFITGLVESMVSKTQLAPKQLDSATLGETRSLLRDQPQAADAILYGAVRDLSRRTLSQRPDRTEIETTSAVQLTIQDAKTGNILWSDLIEARATTTTDLGWWELVQQYGPMVLARKWYILVPLLAVGALMVLAIFFWLMRRAR